MVMTVCKEKMGFLYRRDVLQGRALLMCFREQVASFSLETQQVDSLGRGADAFPRTLSRLLEHGETKYV
jgi:hypothetical protein